MTVKRGDSSSKNHQTIVRVSAPSQSLKLLARLILLLVAFVGISLAVLYCPQVQTLDQNLFVWAALLNHPDWIRLNQMISFLGSAEFIIPAGFILMILLLIRGWMREALWSFTFIALGLYANSQIKYFFSRTRPWGLRAEEHFSLSYPSGHAFGAALFYFLILLILIRLYGRKIKPVLLLPTLFLILLIGLSRIFLSAHWGSDVMGGYLWAGVWITLWQILALKMHFFEVTHEKNSSATH